MRVGYAIFFTFQGTDDRIIIMTFVLSLMKGARI